MAYPRANVRTAGLAKDARNGDGWLAYVQPNIQALDANQVLTAAQISSGLYVRNGMTAGRIDTTDTAVAILAALPEMDIGDTYMLAISVSTAFALTLASGVGMTVVGAKTIVASGFAFVLFTKIGTAAMTYQVL